MADSGQGIDISGLPDPKMKAALAHLFQILGLRKPAAGLYTLPQGHPPVLPAIQPFLRPSGRPDCTDAAVPRQPGDADVAAPDGREDVIGPAGPPPEAPRKR